MVSSIGRTEGPSNRIMRTNRVALLPTLIRRDQDNGTGGNDILHGRLDELLVFEILKDGGTAYKQFNVRTLYRYVVKSIRQESSKNAPSTRAAVGGSQSPDKVPEQVLESLLAEPISFPLGGERPRTLERTGPVTWRELLGGFLHPRDMRKLVTPFSASNEPELIVRRHAILVNFDPLRAIILRDRALVLVPHGADSLLVQLEQRIRGETHGGVLNERQSTGISGSSSSPALDKLDSTGTIHGDGTETVDAEEEDDFRESLISTEWDELDAKDWIHLPFELQCVDSVLSTVSAILTDEVLDLQIGANGVIADLTRTDGNGEDRAQETLRSLKNVVRETTSRVNGFNRALDTVLGDNEDMALMNLSRLLTHPERYIQPVPEAVLEEESDEPELILEAHLQRGNTLVNAISLVEGQIRSTEDFAIRRSETIGNRILYINMVVTILTLAVTIGATAGSFFGMNVSLAHYEEIENGFPVIVGTTTFGMISLVVVFLVGLRRMRALPNVFSNNLA